MASARGIILRELYVSLAAVGGLLLLLGVVGGLLKERTPISEPLIALLAGVLIGPAALGLLDLAELGNETLILEEAALVTLGIALVGVALRLPSACLSTATRRSGPRFCVGQAPEVIRRLIARFNAGSC
jgi:NhaP-type Na+/H+ or K+/H+ antiporter